MFTKKRQDMRSSCLANHVTPATHVTETKNCLYISRYTPLFWDLVRFPCSGGDLEPSALQINKLPSCLSITVVDLLSRSFRRYGLRITISMGHNNINATGSVTLLLEFRRKADVHVPT